MVAEQDLSGQCALPYTVAAVVRFGHAVVSCTAQVQLARVAQRQSTCLVIRR